MKFLPFVLCIAQSLNMQLAAPPRHCPPPRVPCKEGVQGREWRSNRPPLVSRIPPGQIFLSGASGRKFFGILAFFFFLLKKSRNGVFGSFGWGGEAYSFGQALCPRPKLGPRKYRRGTLDSGLQGSPRPYIKPCPHPCGCLPSTQPKS